MPNDNSKSAADENHRLRKALEDCRQLLKRTQELLDRAQRHGGPRSD